MTNRTRRVTTLASAVALALSLGTGSALAFEPPSGDPAEVFDCVGGPVAGHPGAEGLSDAMDASDTRTAWLAHDYGAVGNC